MQAQITLKYDNGARFTFTTPSPDLTIWEEVLETDPYNKKVLEAVNGAKERIKRAQSEE